MDEDVVISKINERLERWYVDGIVVRAGRVLKSSFVVTKADVASFTYDQFLAYCRRMLPLATEDKRWDAQGRELTA